MTQHMRDKVIVITGAASGFGRLVSEKAAAMGARVVVADINPTELAVTHERCAAHGPIESMVTDVTKLDQMTALARRAVERFDRIDVWVNNAGVMPLAFYADHARAMSAWE